MSGRLAKLAKNFAVVPFLWADDSSSLTNRPSATLISDSLQALNKYGKYLSGVIPFLEPGDVGNTGKVLSVISAVVQNTSLPVILHTNPVGTGPDFSKITSYLVAGVDGIAFQLGNPASHASPGDMQKVTKAIKTRWPALKVIAMEYAFSKPSLGDAAIAVGVDGVGNECSRVAVEKLPKWLKMV